MLKNRLRLAGELTAFSKSPVGRGLDNCPPYTPFLWPSPHVNKMFRPEKKSKFLGLQLYKARQRITALAQV